MKVYIICDDGEYEGRVIRGVFETRQAAELAADKLHEEWAATCRNGVAPLARDAWLTIEEHEVRSAKTREEGKK